MALPAALPERPLRLLPRWAGIALLLAVLVACLWNVASLKSIDGALDGQMAERTERGDRLDMDLYRTVNARVAAGENYYTAATDEHRRTSFPTRPFVAVRTPVLAWTSAIWGSEGWRALAIALWAANVLAWYAAFSASALRVERAGAGLSSAFFGAIAFVPDVATSHEALAGLILSLALALRERFRVAALVLAAFATALRLLGLPFLLLWAGLCLLERRWREAAMVGAAIALLGIGIVFHAHAVADARLPGDLASPGWNGLVGPALPLHGIHLVTVLQQLPWWLAGPLGVLPLFGWAALGGRQGTFAFGWFAGFALFVALFARAENFYWMALFVPAYGVGLAFVPRGIADCLSARGGSRSIARATP